MAPEPQATAQQDPHRLNRTNDDPSIMDSCLSRFDFVVIDENARIISKGGIGYPFASHAVHWACHACLLSLSGDPD
jgi:hypothetical protein